MNSDYWYKTTSYGYKFLGIHSRQKLSLENITKHSHFTLINPKQEWEISARKALLVIHGLEKDLKDTKCRAGDHKCMATLNSCVQTLTLGNTVLVKWNRTADKMVHKLWVYNAYSDVTIELSKSKIRNTWIIQD